MTRREEIMAKMPNLTVEQINEKFPVGTKVMVNVDVEPERLAKDPSLEFRCWAFGEIAEPAVDDMIRYYSQPSGKIFHRHYKRAKTY